MRIVREEMTLDRKNIKMRVFFSIFSSSVICIPLLTHFAVRSSSVLLVDKLNKVVGHQALEEEEAVVHSGEFQDKCIC